jgi:hypothetical protein
MTKRLTLLAVSFLPLMLVAQLETTADWKRQVYDREVTGGVMFHTRGYGITLRSMYFIDGYKKHGVQIDLVNIRHPKEVKFPSQYFFNSARSFVFGKINGLYSVRVGYCRDKVLIDKTDQGSISVSWVTTGGASLGILKPIYLEILKETAQGIQVLSTERYNPDVHNHSDIYGQAAFFTGIEESKLRTGIYLKSGFAFDYNWTDHKVTTLEIGAIVDYFPSWFGLYQDEFVPIMFETKNYNVWLQFYLAVNFGKKWN